MGLADVDVTTGEATDEHLTNAEVEWLRRELADIRAAFEASDTDTIRRLRAELAARDHELQQLQEQYDSLLRLPEGDRRELARYTEFRKLRGDHQRTMRQIASLVVDALGTDGAQHKQWYLQRIRDIFGTDITEHEWDAGIAP